MATKEQVHYALMMRDRHGIKLKDTAKELGINPNRIHNEARKHEVLDDYLAKPDTPLSACNGFNPDMAIGC